MSGVMDRNTPVHVTVGGLDDLLKSVAAFVHEQVAAATEPLKGQIAELEARGEYAGTWASDRRFKKGQIVTYDGSAWIAKMDSLNVRPATDREHWQLMVRRGADGKDLRDAAR